MYCMIHIQNPVYYHKLRHIQGYLRPIHTIFNHVVAYLEPCVTLRYSDHCHIQHPGILRTQDIYIFTTVVCLHIENPAIFRTVLYSKYCVLEAYSGIFNNDIYNMNFFFYFNLTYFSTKFKTFIF